MELQTIKIGKENIIPSCASVDGISVRRTGIAKVLWRKLDVKVPASQVIEGGAYLWLGGGGSKQTCPCFTIPGVKAGQKLTISMESHKLNPADARGIQIYANSYDAANQIGEAFKPTVKASNTWAIDKDCDVVVWNTSGCHIYTMTIE